jgi:ABC-type multidrug transport system ATPase subunit
MTVVKALTADNVTICATIHSPSGKCFALFDRLLFLVRGMVVYTGPNDATAIAHLQAAVCTRPPKYPKPRFPHGFNSYGSLHGAEGRNSHRGPAGGGAGLSCCLPDLHIPS